MSPLLELLILLVALAVVGFLGLDFLRGRNRQREEHENLERLRGDYESEEVPAQGMRSTERLLLAAGLGWRPMVWMAATLIIGVIFFFGAFSLLPTAPWVAVVVAGFAIYFAWTLLKEWGRFRGRRFERKLVDGVDQIVSALLAGENPTQALASAGQGADEPVAGEFRAVLNRLDLGSGIGEALAPMRLKFDSEGTRLFTQTMAVKWRIGGDLAPVLRSVSWIMRERVRMNMRLRSELTGVQVAALALTLLPYVLIPFFMRLLPGWLSTLTNHPLGPPLLVSAIVLQILGLLWVRRIIRIEL